jgi:Ca2+-binding RTX toxin-like protein
MAGNDELYGDGISNSGDDVLYGNAGNDKLYAFEGNDKLYGGDNDDLLAGFIGNDTLHGDAGNDALFGVAGNDFLYGGAGDDRLLGGNGKDILAGNEAKDSFVYSSLTDSGTTPTIRDVIVDFKHTEGDKIDMHDMDASALVSGNQDFIFIGSKPFSGTAQLRFDAKTHILYASNDADTAPEFSVQLMGITNLQAQDFIL